MGRGAQASLSLRHAGALPTPFRMLVALALTAAFAAQNLDTEPLLAYCKKPWWNPISSCVPSNDVARNVGSASERSATDIVSFDFNRTTTQSVYRNTTLIAALRAVLKQPGSATRPPPKEEGRRLEIESVGSVSRQLFGPDSRRPVGCSDSEAGPFQMMVRLSTGCSGVMVGSRHVLTAGHCVYSWYDSAGNELKNKGWKMDANRKVFVGYSREWGCPTGAPSGTGTLWGSDVDGVQTVRWVEAISMMTYTGFVESGDAEYDIALIEVKNRPETRRSASAALTGLPWMTFGFYSNPSYRWTWCTAGWPGDLSPPLQLHAECSRDKVQDIEGKLFEMELDGAQGQSGSPLWPALSPPQSNGGHGAMFSDKLEAGPAQGVFALLYQEVFWFFGWWVINESNDFARIDANRFVSLCAWISDHVRAGEFNPCAGVL